MPVVCLSIQCTREVSGSAVPTSFPVPVNPVAIALLPAVLSSCTWLYVESAAQEPARTYI